jgi:hypothetical protein
MNILFLTSTISPNRAVSMLAYRDPEKRIQDYIKAFEFYANRIKNNTFDRLVYVDNSGYSLSSLEKIANQTGISERCQFISFTTVPPENVSRYCLELNLMQEGMRRSSLLEDERATIWKVTGRYIVANIENIVSKAPQNADLYINCRNFPERVCDFYLVRFNRLAYDRLIARDTEEFRTARSGELILRERIDTRFEPDISIVPRFNVTPRLNGVRGWDGARYGGPKDLSKYLVRAVFNRLAPGLWL